MYYSGFDIMWLRVSVIESTETVKCLFMSVNTKYILHETYKITASFLRNYLLHWIAVALNNINFVVNSNWKIPFDVHFIMMKDFWGMALCLSLIFRMFRACYYFHFHGRRRTGKSMEEIFAFCMERIRQTIGVGSQ